jgi:hypothetical protein
VTVKLLPGIAPPYVPGVAPEKFSWNTVVASAELAIKPKIVINM